MGDVQNSSGNSGGVGVISVVKNWKFRGGGGGGLHEIPSVVGVWIFSGTTQSERAYYCSRIIICINDHTLFHMPGYLAKHLS